MRPRPIAALARLRGRPAAHDPARPAADRTRTLGQSMVEFALILPIMLLLVGAAVDLGRLFFAYVAVENAAKEGVMYGARHPLCADSTNVNCDTAGQNVTWYVENEAATGLKTALGASNLTTGVTCRAKTTGALRQPINDCVNGDTYEVRVSYGMQDVELHVCDRGTGGVAPARVGGGGHGLVGMRERVRIFGGELHTGRRAGGGFEVRARIPLDGRAEHA